MAKIEYLKNGPGALRGAVRIVDDRSAKALVGLGYARYYEAKVVKPQATPAPQDQDDTAGESAPKKREYKRRDLKAEK